MNRGPEETLFELALKMPTEKRHAFLAVVSAGEPALAKRLEALLAAREQTGGIPAETVASEASTMKIEPLDAAGKVIGTIIGRYKVLEMIGEGGCGAVY